MNEVCILHILVCKASEDKIIQMEDLPEMKTFVPGRQDILMHQQTEAIRRIVHAKSLELEKPFDINDSLLLSKCQEIAAQQRSSNTRIQAEALTNDTDFEEQETTTKKVEETINVANNEEKVNITSNIPNITKEDHSDQHESQTQIVDKIDNQVAPSQQELNPYYNKPPLYYIYPQFVPEVPENVEKQPETSTSSTTQAPMKMYTEKLRFILRMPYPKGERLANFPWEFDKYAYYPKHLQPEFVNMPVPYVPTYHMIRRLVVPSKVAASYVVETNT